MYCHAAWILSIRQIATFHMPSCVTNAHQDQFVQDMAPAHAQACCSVTCTATFNTDCQQLRCLCKATNHLAALAVVLHYCSNAHAKRLNANANGAFTECTAQFLRNCAAQQVQHIPEQCEQDSTPAAVQQTVMQTLH
jgi:hypothetical protein